MERSAMRVVCGLVVVGLVAIGVVPAVAGTTVYTDEAAFLGAVTWPANPGMAMESFEGLNPTNSFTASSFPLPDFTLTELSGGDELGVFNVPAGWGGYATDGQNYIQYQSDSNQTLRFDFGSAINAFGINITDWGDWADPGQLVFSNDAGDSFTIAVTPRANNNYMFYGVVNDSMQFNRVEFLNTVPGEAYAIDEVYYGNSGAPQIPEPATLSLVGLGLLALARRRKNR